MLRQVGGTETDVKRSEVRQGEGMQGRHTP